jgi:4-amino-4-deoxy-L-arabinose transferase-like glycosyltransferase
VASFQEADPGDADRLARRLGALTVAALVVRLAFLIVEPATHPVGDERTWTDWAVNLASPRVAYSPLRIHLIFYPPVYPYFLAALYGAAGTFEAVRWAQAAVGALLVPALGLAGARAFSPRVGLWAAGVAAFYPDLVWFSVHFWSETVFMVLLWWGIERLLAADRGGAVGAAIASGLLWGMAILTRETILYFVPLAAAWLFLRGTGRARAQGAAFLLAALLVVAPWTYRNWAEFHAFVPVSTAGGQNLFQGNALIPRDETYVMVDAVQGRVEQYRYAMRMGLQAIRDRQPWWIFEKLRDEMPRLWEADSLALIHIKRGAYGAVAPPVAVAAALVILVPYVAVLALFAIGLVHLPRTRPVLLLLAFFAYYNLIHVVTHGFARYRLPIMPVVFLIAGLGWAAWRAGDLPRLSRGRRLAVAAFAVAVIAVLTPSFRLNIGHPAFGLTDTGGPPGADAPEP